MKRKVDEESDIDVSSTDESESEQIEEEDANVEVDFDFFDLNPEVDFHAFKTLLRQLFGDDAKLFDLSSLADVILKKEAIGTTIKVDGKESDPYAMVSIVDAKANQPCITQIMDYLLEKTQKETELNMFMRTLLGKQSKKSLGWVVSERLINMPVEVMPPMYQMLLDEMDKGGLSFDYYIVVSKIYRLVAPQLQDEQQTKKKKLPEEVADELDYFHYEDSILEQHAKYYNHFDYTHKSQETDSRRVFTDHGIDPKLSVIVLDKNGLKAAVAEMSQAFTA
ncbi:protein Bcp1p [Diutina catenulata]